MKTLVLYTRPGCHLCDEARAVIDRVRNETAFGLRAVDISRHPDLEERYRYDIPVIAIEGVERFRHSVDEAQLRAVLASEGP